MSFYLSNRSMRNLEGVDPALTGLVKWAILHTKIDFAVIEGLRTKERQRKLVDSGASRTMSSNHLTGRAVDLMAYVDGRASWELPVYYKVAEAMQEAARVLDVSIRWGGCWTLTDIRDWDLPMEEATTLYIEQRLLAGHSPFIDAPHFELSPK